MRYLYQGSQSQARFELLVSLTRIQSLDVIDALKDFLVHGASDSNAAALNGVDKSNFNRALAKIELVAATVETIKEIDLGYRCTQ